MRPLVPSLSWFLASRHPAAVERHLPNGIRIFNTVLNTAVWLILAWWGTDWLHAAFLA